MRFSSSVLMFRRLAARGLAAVAAVLIVAGGWSAAPAQVAPMDESDKRAFVDYKLTLEKVDKVTAVCKKIVEAGKADPQIGKEMQALREDQNGTLEQINGVFSKQAPHVLVILKGEGMEAREYMLGLLSTMFARMAANIRASGSTELPDFIPAANVDLAEKNAAKFDEANRAIGDLDTLGRPAGL